MIKIGIIEDEVLIADNMCRNLEQLGYECCTPCISYSKAIKMIETEHPDLLLIDINLAGRKDGIDLAVEIKSNYKVPFIFLTSISDPNIISRAKHLEPSSYLIKPFSKEDLFAAIEIAIHNFMYKKNLEKNVNNIASEKFPLQDSIFVKKNNNFHKIKFSDIIILESEHIYLEITTINGSKYSMRSSLNEFLEKIELNYIFRVHKKYAINLNYLESFNSEEVVVKGIQIPLGASFKGNLFHLINKK